jgi:hypothetical protein
VSWQCPVKNNTTNGVVTVCVEPSVQIMTAENMDALKAKYGEAWVNHWNTAEGAEWVSPSNQKTANLQPGESVVITGEIALPKGVEMVMPGDNTKMNAKLIVPVALEEGQRFAIREGGHTVGAGAVTKILA